MLNECFSSLTISPVLLIALLVVTTLVLTLSLLDNSRMNASYEPYARAIDAFAFLPAFGSRFGPVFLIAHILFMVT